MQILRSTANIDFFLKEIEPMSLEMSLADYIDFLLKEKQITKNKILQKSLVDQNYAYQIMNGRKQNPARDILIRIAFAFPLTVKETQLLLYLGNASKLYVKDKRDSIILYALENNLGFEFANDSIIKNNCVTLI